MVYLYGLLNKLTNEIIYVGITKNTKLRLLHHWSGTQNPRLWRFIRQHGKHNLDLKVLAIVEAEEAKILEYNLIAKSKWKLLNREKFFKKNPIL